MAETEVYVIQGVAPEITAYAMAKYSRSALSMRESLRELDGQKAEKFLNTFYFQYGHRSIADLAHLSIAVERLSILAAIEVADETRWDGQERSTRYQEFKRTGFVTPAELAGDENYQAVLSRLFGTYEKLTPAVTAYLETEHSCPKGMTAEAYRRTLRARAFDVTRYLLPLATATSLGQIVSARTLEQQISRLLSSPLAECREVGAALKTAASAPGAVPTLVKYTDPCPYWLRSREELASAAAAIMAEATPDSTPGVALLSPGNLEIELAASLLYPHCAHSYRQVLAQVEALTAARRQEVVDLGSAHRGRHDELLREYQAGAPLQFDILMDIGGFRDLHRHRRCVQLHQGFSAQHGYETPELLAACGAEGEYRAAMEAAGRYCGKTAGGAGAYALPLGYRKRSLFKMDFAQAAYITELRTGAAGHFSYRQAAWEMYEAMRQRYPALVRDWRVTDPRLPSNPFDR